MVAHAQIGEIASVEVTLAVSTPDVAVLFRLARDAARLSPPEAAEALGQSANTYLRTERGERIPRRSEIVAFARITGQTREWESVARELAGVRE